MHSGTECAARHQPAGARYRPAGTLLLPRRERCDAATRRVRVTKRQQLASPATDERQSEHYRISAQKIVLGVVVFSEALPGAVPLHAACRLRF